MNWPLVADVLGVTAFVVVVAWGSYRRLSWIFRESYLLSRLEKRGARPEAWFVFRNPGPFSRSIYSASLKVTSAGAPDPAWKTALFIPAHASEVLTVIPPGDHIRQMNMQLVLLDGKLAPVGPADENHNPTIPKAWSEREHRVFGHMMLVKCPIEAELNTSEGKVVLKGQTGIGEPIATEGFDWRRRLLRVL